MESLSYFIPYVQRKAHLELKPGDFVRVQGRFYIVDEVRRFRRRYDYTATTTASLVELTGSLTKRFQHIDKFSVEPGTGVTVTVAMTYRGVDVTGLQYAHTWNQQNANVFAPNELDINSFSREDIINVTVTFTVGAVASLWFSGEEYTLVEYPATNPETGVAQMPPRFVMVVPYGFSRVVTSAEFVGADMAGRLRT